MQTAVLNGYRTKNSFNHTKSINSNKQIKLEIKDFNLDLSFVNPLYPSIERVSSGSEVSLLKFNKLPETKYVTISLSNKFIAKDGVFNMGTRNIEKYENYVQSLNKIFFIFNSIIFAITSLFIIIPAILWGLDKMQPYEVAFSSIVGITGNLIIFSISRETKAKVVEKCRQKMHN